MKRFVLPVALGVVAALASSCGEDRERRARPQVDADFAILRDSWNGSALESFVAHVDQARYLEDRATMATSLAGLRRQIGAIVQSGDALIDTQPEDPRAYVVAHLVFAAEAGVGRFSLVYDRDLQRVGFHVEGNTAPAAPR